MKHIMFSRRASRHAFGFTLLEVLVALVIVGTALAAVGMLTLGLRLEPDSGYVAVILPSLLAVALGMGLAFVALTSAAVAGVPKADAGIASALLNAGQQVGGALGLAILTAVSTARTEAIGVGVPGTPQFVDALVAGWSAGFLVAAAFLAIAGIIAASLVRVSKEDAAAALK